MPSCESHSISRGLSTCRRQPAACVHWRTGRASHSCSVRCYDRASCTAPSWPAALTLRRRSVAPAVAAINQLPSCSSDGRPCFRAHADDRRPVSPAGDARHDPPRSPQQPKPFVCPSRISTYHLELIYLQQQWRVGTRQEVEISMQEQHREAAAAVAQNARGVHRKGAGVAVPGGRGRIWQKLCGHRPATARQTPQPASTVHRTYRLPRSEQLGGPRRRAHPELQSGWPTPQEPRHTPNTAACVTLGSGHTPTEQTGPLGGLGPRTPATRTDAGPAFHGHARRSRAKHNVHTERCKPASTNSTVVATTASVPLCRGDPLP
jgi:hypothetical protein